MVTSFASKPRVDNPSVGKNFKPAPSRTSPSSGSSSDQSSSSRSNGSSAPSSSSSGSSQQNVSSRPASTPGIIQALGVGSGPLSQTPNFGTGPSSPAGQNFARQAAQSGSANFSSRSGQAQQVSSSSSTSQSSTPRPSTIQDAGVTRALASGGAFGSGQNTFAQASYNPIQTRNNINQTPPPNNNGSASSFATGGAYSSGMVVGSSLAQQEKTERYDTRLQQSIARQEAYFSSPSLKRVQDLASFGTGGVNLNPFSRRFLIQTPTEQRSFLGQVAEKGAYAGLAFPQLTVGYGISSGEKIAAAAEGFTVPSARRYVGREVFFDAPVRTVRGPLNPTTPEGFTNYAIALTGGSLSARSQMTTPRSVRVSSSRGVVGESSVAGDSISGFATSRSVGSASYP